MNVSDLLAQDCRARLAAERLLGMKQAELSNQGLPVFPVETNPDKAAGQPGLVLAPVL